MTISLLDFLGVDPIVKHASEGVPGFVVRTLVKRKPAGEKSVSYQSGQRRAVADEVTRVYILWKICTTCISIGKRNRRYPN